MISRAYKNFNNNVARNFVYSSKIKKNSAILYNTLLHIEVECALTTYYATT